jgi:hypothetical protein
MWLRLVSHSPSFCLLLPSAEITGVQHISHKVSKVVKYMDTQSKIVNNGAREKEKRRVV